MNPYLLGINPLYFYALFIILAIIGSIVISRYKLNYIKGSTIGVMLIVLAILGFTNFNSYMSGPISLKEAEQIDQAFDKSFEKPDGKIYRTALLDLGQRKGNTTAGSTFAVEGSRVYLDYVTKKDFNELVKIYKEIE
ncbi:hypothetical protein [Acinetobacter pittii]|uniref:hypothetical protein n=1 Tax=Acinetobacter pittii TaxID=48296 RepID=UPI0036F45E4C